MRFDELLRDAVGVDDCAERCGVSVGERVVTDDAFDLHAQSSVERDRALQDSRCGRAFLIVVDLRVGDAGVIVDHGVDVVVAEASLAGRTFAATVKPPSSSVRDTTELLHVDVEQRAGMVVLVAADRFAGGPVDMAEPVHPA